MEHLKKSIAAANCFRLNSIDRVKELRKAKPSLLCVDRQSVKLNPMLENDRGTDGNKGVNGRKIQYLVDSGGRLCVVVHAANITDGKWALSLLDKLNRTLRKILRGHLLQRYFCKCC